MFDLALRQVGKLRFQAAARLDDAIADGGRRRHVGDAERFELARPTQRNASARREGRPRDRKLDAAPQLRNRVAQDIDRVAALGIDDGPWFRRRAFAKASRAGKARKPEHVIRVAVRDRDDRRRKRVRSKRERQTFAGVDDQLQWSMPEPVRIHGSAVSLERVRHFDPSIHLCCPSIRPDSRPFAPNSSAQRADGVSTQVNCGVSWLTIIIARLSCRRTGLARRMSQQCNDQLVVSRPAVRKRLIVKSSPNPTRSGRGLRESLK